MCGIVGYQGQQPAAALLLQGLSRLEYRGYDSAGIALADKRGLALYKEAGRLSVLTARLNGGEGLPQTTGIGHTRWATHGKPSTVNAHPHSSANGRFAVVHNGVIENEAVLRRELIEAGVTLRSDTDTELVAHLLEREECADIWETLRRVTARLTGSFALAIVCAAQPHTVYAVRQHSPLVLGVAEDGVFLASDMPAVIPYTDRVIPLQDGEMACLSNGNYEIRDADGNRIERAAETVAWRVEQADSGEYAHFMLKEIREQPEALAETLFPFLLPDGSVSEEVLPLTADEAAELHRVVLVGCGSAYHAGMVGKQVIERLARISAETDLASEFRYREPLLDAHTLVIFISQSGETADTLAALREAKARGARVLSIVNVAGSSLAMESELVLLTRAGPEIAVATTKAYTAQLAALYLIAIRLAALRGCVDAPRIPQLTACLRELPSQVGQLLDIADAMKTLAETMIDVNDAYFIGRGLDYATAREASLKLKEISYIHSEAYAAGEMKHGSISLIEEGTLVVAIACEPSLLSKTMSNVQEVRARGARAVLITTQAQAGQDVFVIPQTDPLFQASLSIVPLQLLGYYTALFRGCDIDHPRNLAKSVTVE